MPQADHLRELEVRIRHLCQQLLSAHGAEFESGLLELKTAIDLLEEVKEPTNVDRPPA